MIEETTNYAENFDNDVAAYIKHYITNNATEPSNVNAELGFSFYKYGNKTHLGIDCATLNKYASSHNEDTVIVALNAVCINTIQYYTDSPKTVTELLSNALAERKLSLEKVNSKVIIFGYNSDEDTGEIETTEILEAWKQAQSGEHEDPNSGNTDPNDPGTGGNDDPNQNEPSGGDDPDPNDPGTGGNDDPNSGDDPSGTQDEFDYERTPGQITKIIVNYNVLEKNNETGKITFNDTFEPVNDNEFKVGKVHYSETRDYSGVECTDEQNFEYITDSCDNTYFYRTNNNSNDPSDPSSVSINDPPSDKSLAWIERLKRGSRKITTSEKLLISVDTSSTETDIGESYNDYNGDSFSSKIVRNLLTNTTLKNTMMANYKIYYGLTSQNIEISDDELSSFVLNHAYLGNENNVLYLCEELKTTDSDVYDVNENISYCPNKIKFDNVSSSWGIDVSSELVADPNFYFSGNVRTPSESYTCTNCIALRAHNTGTALNVFILDDIDRYFDENFDQNEYELHKQPKINKLVVHFGDITSRTVDKNDFNETTYHVGSMQMPKTSGYDENYDSDFGDYEEKQVDLSLLTDDNGAVYSAKTNIFGNDYLLSENLVKLSSSDSILITVPDDLDLSGYNSDTSFVQNSSQFQQLISSEENYGLDRVLSEIIAGNCGNSTDPSIQSLKSQLISYFATYYNRDASELSSMKLVSPNNIIIASPNGFATVRAPNTNSDYKNISTDK